MATYDKNLITCVEFGTHSIRALHGICDKAGNPVVLGVGQELSEGCVCKGEVIDSQQAAMILGKALADADKSAGIVNDRRCVYCIVNGAGVVSRQGEGQVFIYSDDHKIHQTHIMEAVNKAQNIALPPDQVLLGSFDSYFLLDSQNRTSNPEGIAATRLDAFLHILSMNRKPMEVIRSILREQGFEDQIEFVFSPVAAAYGTLEEKEKRTRPHKTFCGLSGENGNRIFEVRSPTRCQLLH